MKSPYLSTRSSTVHLAGTVVLALIGMAMIAKAQNLPCIETNGIKIWWPPNLDNGWDVKDSRNNIVLADDFPCNTTGPITDIHLWGSWLNNIKGTVTNFWIGIYDDVPAVTNFLNGQVTPSHPGTNLLWQQSFGSGQYSEQFAGSGSELFFDPSSVPPQIMGSDNAAYYYCFYPTNPFVQQGTAAQPTNYWLAVHAKLSDQTSLYGWKTALTAYNDAAVWGTVQPGTGVPIGDWQSMTNTQTHQPINLAFKLTTPTNTPPPTVCVETNGVKYVQWPNLFGGLDVWNSSSKPTQVTDGPWWLADDFVCTNTGPITDIHLWGSWQNDQALPGSITFQLYVFDDVPANAANLFSHPGTNVLWHQTFAPGSYAETVWTANAAEYFFDPGPPTILGGDSVVWYYCFNPTNLAQYGSTSQPTNYWLAAFAELPTGTTSVFGWKTTTNVQHDISVHSQWLGFGVPPTNSLGWIPTHDVTGLPVDLAFKLTTPTNNTPPPTACVETNGVKYVQWPNLFGGLDVWDNGPWMLADDFKCTNSGPITDIHIWGSWINDLPITGALTFSLGIYDDVPVAAGNTFSHPGTNLLWQQTFTPGQYAETFWSYGQESFLDPGPPQIIGPDSQVWYYCFYPTNPFVQTGGAAAPKTYWLAAYAQLPAGYTSQYGWKTTTNVQNDISVHAPWPGSLPTSNPGWTPTLQSSTGGPLDLAFKLTTPTNNCVVPIACQVDRTIECGSSWSFDPPLVGPDSCCPAAPLVTFSAVTNLSGTCKEIITGTWIITDCRGVVVGTCTQNVTIVDTTPPTITCPTNIVVFTCNTNAIVFWSILATDTCSSVTVTSSPPSGTAFLPNTTNTVTATVRDACGNTNNCTFTVAIRRPVLGLVTIKYPGTNIVVLTWTNGFLQVSTNVIGPYVDVPGATSPYTNTTLPMPPTNRFYRLRCNSP